MNRERITITLEAALLPAIDGLIDGSSVRNRSHAIEVAIRRGLAIQELGSYYFIYRHNYDPEICLPILNSLDPADWYIVAPTVDMANAQTWLQSLAQLSKVKPLSTTAVPADFGSAGALLLHQNKWRQQILIVDMQVNQSAPTNFLNGYSNHTQQSCPLTSFVRWNGKEYSSTGWYLTKTDIAQEIPAGFVSLEETTFPQLAKAGKVNLYVTPA